MKKNKPTFRHELKYLISEPDLAMIIARISDVIQIDENAQKGKYTVRSLYFDDMWNSAYQDKLIGIASRKKYRIRVYDNSDKVIKLEKKSKENQYIYKEAASLTREEVEKILAGDYGFLQYMNENHCKEFYLECVANGMRPKVMVDYERIPYTYYAGDVRITFDRHVRAGMLNYNLFDSALPTLEALEPGTLIMEVKYTEFLPQIIRNILPPENSDLTAASKYVMCFEKRYGINE